MLTLEQLRDEVSAGSIDTVLTVCPDLYGRLMGKLITGAFFLDQTARAGMEACDYLLACDMEMDPVPGYKFTSWESGYVDFHVVPDFSSLRRAAWLPNTAFILCDLLTASRDRPIEVSPRRMLQRQLLAARAAGLS